MKGEMFFDVGLPHSGSYPFDSLHSQVHPHPFSVPTLVGWQFPVEDPARLTTPEKHVNTE